MFDPFLVFAVVDFEVDRLHLVSVMTDAKEAYLENGSWFDLTLIPNYNFVAYERY